MNATTPWKTKTTKHDGGVSHYVVDCTDNESVICQIRISPEENARRIVACVNACRGMTYEQLEEMAKATA
jgi:hypothetical protein